ncbi:MAG TPA: GNAT family N-acetyltransferase [Candidatus Limnocylindria bacterium]|jgi:GNAT superfamily N-acetyltransferase|nr:GNAT family N-acetyltransferase [Candidatus Limnocylindria bacterium]
MSLEILRLDGPTFDAAIPDLAVILADAVAGGASVGFTLPFSPEDAATWWQSIERDVVRGDVLVIVARLDRRVVGTAQLRLAQWPNARHRAEVAKVLVHRSARRRGIATALMHEIERIAFMEGRTLLVLDTIAGSEAVELYTKLGWTRVAEIPRYAGLPDGELRPTTIFYRDLEPKGPRTSP